MLAKLKAEKDELLFQIPMMDVLSINHYKGKEKQRAHANRICYLNCV